MKNAQKNDWALKPGHEYLADSVSLKTQPNIQYTRKPNKIFITSITALTLVMLLFFADGLLQAYRSDMWRELKTFASQAELARLTGTKQVLSFHRLLKDLGQQYPSKNIDVLDRELSFFGQNGFVLPNDKGIIYINAANFVGRAVSFMANSYQVAIIVKVGKDFELPQVSEELGIITQDQHYYLGGKLLMFKASVPRQHWNWFARQLAKNVV